MNDSEIISSLVESKREQYIEASDRIWGFAEFRFQERNSASLLRELLSREGFSVETGTGGLETAFCATYGSGRPFIGFLGEYDALANLSQEAGVAEKKAMQAGACGHGCGHNGLGVGSLAAAVALKDYLKTHPGSGTIRYYGCPGEEIGSGKAFMAGAHVFDDLDVAFSWHPGDTNGLFSDEMAAITQAYFKFSGVSAHAGAAPQMGRSALDAVELMDVGANYLREHIPQEARIHYAIVNAGGPSANVVPAEAEVFYMVRAPRFSQARAIFERLQDVAKGAALMTGTSCEISIDSGTSSLVLNETLNRLLQESFEAIGPQRVDESDLAFARDIASTFPEPFPEDRFRRLDSALKDRLRSSPIANIVFPYPEKRGYVGASTDVGDVSWIVPTAQCRTACYALGTPGHSWQTVAQGKLPLFHQGVLLAAKVLALSGLRVLQRPDIIERAKRDHVEELHGESYICPIPAGVKPSSR